MDTRTRQLVTLAIAGAMVGLLPVHVITETAFAAPGNVGASRAQLDDALREYETAAQELRSVDQQAKDASAELDTAVARQREAQARLSVSVTATYRLGPTHAIDMLLGSADVEELTDRMVYLTRMDSSLASDLKAAKKTRQQSIDRAQELLEIQERASAKTRALEDKVAKARARFATDQAALAAYQARVKEAEAARQEAPADVAASSGKKGKPKTTSATGEESGWATAVCSNYGPGSYGRRTADGTRVGPDSMIVAHKTLAFGTLVEFSYGGRNVVGRVADRGPFVPGRTFDLGPGVARSLGLNGVYNVRYRIIGR